MYYCDDDGDAHDLDIDDADGDDDDDKDNDVNDKDKDIPRRRRQEQKQGIHGRVHEQFVHHQKRASNTMFTPRRRDDRTTGLPSEVEEW